MIKRLASRRDTRGVAAIEFMMLVPIAVIVVLGVTQVVLVALAKSNTADAALAAARADTLGRDPSTAATATLGKVGTIESVREDTSGAWRVSARVVTVFPGSNVVVHDEARLPDTLASGR